MVSVQTIGSGTGAPSATRVCSSHLVETGSLRILFDCGSGAVHRMAKLGIDWMGITHLFVTHFHADHISDIATLVYAWRYGALPPRTSAIDIIGPPGFALLFDRMDAVFGGDMKTLGFDVRIGEMAAGSTLVLADGVGIGAHKVPHSEESVAYSLKSGRRRIVYTGDTAFDPTMSAWAYPCDLLLTECSLPATMAVATHMTPEQCGELAALVRPAALALTHFYPPLETVDVRSIVAARFDGNVHLTYDGWKFELED